MHIYWSGVYELPQFNKKMEFAIIIENSDKHLKENYTVVPICGMREMRAKLTYKKLRMSYEDQIAVRSGNRWSYDFAS